MMLLRSYEDETEREEFRRMIHQAPTDTARSLLDWQDDDWVPPGWGTDEQNAAESRAAAAWFRSTAAGKT